MRVIKPGYVLATSAMATFLVFLDTTALYVAYPDLRADFARVSPTELSGPDVMLPAEVMVTLPLTTAPAISVARVTATPAA